MLVCRGRRCKLRTKGNHRGEIKKEKILQWAAAKRSCGVSRWVSSLGYPFQGSSDHNTFPTASLWLLLSSPQIHYSSLLLTVLLALIGVPFDQSGCCAAAWFLSLYMHVIRSLNIKPQAKNRKKRRRKRDESHTGDNSFLWVPAAAAVCLQLSCHENKTDMKSNMRTQEK